jgi:hypothetical protein
MGTQSRVGYGYGYPPSTRRGASERRGLDEAHGLIQRSAWKGSSPKFRCRILHKTGPLRALRHIPDVGKHTRQPYMLW